ncbi:hypothetical protein ASPZODRAFT_448690 [Penicilliopsis zonata CBS 506.65]|uniref:Uncharacterized protein n=1 Tax=Penicilliopsis zonata CBS 506.65 TaxID=1073090 RepID=A0A1L9SWW3_9EURO|nr:hypothetical protein ASPZODRAFT_448690 [Penicilliopsis zonata CBS 506.65]OJJ51685.1 hypothetical protein ASPZODRAFT_448690 [Penicilliopsis zonata CBS 506.65]
MLASWQEARQSADASCALSELSLCRYVTVFWTLLATVLVLLALSDLVLVLFGAQSILDSYTVRTLSIIEASQSICILLLNHPTRFRCDTLGCRSQFPS